MSRMWGWRYWVPEKRSDGVWAALWYRLSLEKRKSSHEGGRRELRCCVQTREISAMHAWICLHWSTIKAKDFCEFSTPEMSRGCSRSWESYEHGQRSSPPGLGEEQAGRGCWRSSEKHQFLWSACSSYGQGSSTMCALIVAQIGPIQIT